ncbi:MAG: HAD-IA family hydrolase [Ruminococcaceae bacterium]|nr:HAD-IA family hydrolase [Oscillospiraceae bacterium]
MKPQPPFDGILFDMDGTLLDTVPHIVETFRHTFKTFNVSDVTDESILASIGTPLETYLASICPDSVAEMVKVYRNHNESNMNNSIGIFLGIPEMLADLRKLDLKLGVVTAKLRSSAILTLSVFGLENSFDEIVVKEDTTRHKPDPEPLQLAMSRLGLNTAERVLYVGDSIHDIKSAHAAGCQACAVDWTYMPKSDLESVTPHYWAAEPQEIVTIANTIQ